MECSTICIFQNYYQSTFSGVGCYPDVFIGNGIHGLHDFYGHNQRNFCANKTRFISTADLVTLTFDDRLSQFQKKELLGNGVSPEKIYAPFHIDYLKVSYDKLSFFLFISFSFFFCLFFLCVMRASLWFDYI